jgi:hypothetical protein
MPANSKLAIVTEKKKFTRTKTFDFFSGEIETFFMGPRALQR